MVYKRVGGLHKGSKKKSEVLKEGKGLKIGVLYRSVFASIILLVNRTKT